MEAWEQFVTQQEKVIGSETADKWLRSLKTVRFDACNLYLEAKDSFQILWFEEHMRHKCQAKLFNNNHRKIKVHVNLPGATPATKKKKQASEPPPFTLQYDSLDPLQNFETFHITDGNILSFKLLKKLSQDNEDLASFNPIYLHGLAGTGKTHLLHSAARELKQKGLNAEYVRAETFTDHVVSAIRAGEMKQFRQSYRNLDVLILDNVDHFSQKKTTQEELFHTFNTLHLNGKQIILASRCPPSELHAVEPRLISRFEWGIVLPLVLQNRKELLSIVKKKGEALQAPVTEPVAQWLVETFSSSSSHLVRALEALMLRTQGKKHPWTVSLAQHYLKDLVLEEQKVSLTPDKILLLIAEQFGIPTEEILGKGQSRECVEPRQFAMYLMRENLALPYAKIGQIFGKDHSTVMTSCKAIQMGIAAQDPHIAPKWREVLKAVKKEWTTKSQTVSM